MAIDRERIAELNRDLASVRQAMRDSIDGGKAFAVSGGIDVKRVDFNHLQARERQLKKQLIIARGGAMRTAPDFTYTADTDASIVAENGGIIGL